MGAKRAKAPPATFQEIFRGEIAFVWRVLRRHGVPRRDLEDVTHEVFLVVHRRLASFDPHRPLRPWLLGIAFRCAAAFRRRSSHRMEEPTGAEMDAEPDTEPLADEQLERQEERASLWRALDALPVERRAVVTLHDIEEVPIPEIATALDVPLATAYSRLRVGRDELLAALKRIRARRRDR